MFYQTSPWNWQRQELYQLWVNLPARDKLSQPYLLLLSDAEETPVIQEKGVFCRVLAGSYDEAHQSSVPTASDLTVLHVSLDPETRWTYEVPETYETLIIYVRQGSLDIEENYGSSSSQIPTHHTAFFDRSGGQLVAKAGSQGADVMVLAGVPLREPVSAQGSMVMNYPDEINEAYRDYQLGHFGSPWSHKLSRDEWLAHVKEFPSDYSNLKEGADLTK